MVWLGLDPGAADETTELWQPPIYYNLKISAIGVRLFPLFHQMNTKR